MFFKSHLTHIHHAQIIGRTFTQLSKRGEHGQMNRQGGATIGGSIGRAHNISMIDGLLQSGMGRARLLWLDFWRRLRLHFWRRLRLRVGLHFWNAWHGWPRLLGRFLARNAPT